MKFRNRIAGLMIAFATVFMLAGCDQDQKALLTDGVWNFSNLTTDSEDEDIQSAVFLVKALMTDATLEFKDDGSYLMNSPLMDEPTSGTWSLIGDDQLILTEDGGVAQTANIDVLSKKELRYLETWYDLSQNSYPVTTSWTR